MVVEEVRNFYDDAIKKGPEMFKNRRRDTMLFNPVLASENKNQGSEDPSKQLPSPKRGKGKKGGGSDALINAGTAIGFGMPI